MPRESVLIVEDEAIVQLHLRRIVEACGYRVSGLARSGEEALASVHAKTPDLVLMDIRLQAGTDGIDTARALRAERDLAVVFVTAHADDETLTRAGATEPMGYVVKPFSAEDIKSAIAIALAQHAAVQCLRRSGQEVERTRQELAGILSVLGLGGAAVDDQGRLTFLSEGMARLLGRSATEALGNGWQAALALAPDEQARVEELMREPAAGRRRIRVRAGTHRRSVDVEVRDDPGDPRRRILILQDSNGGPQRLRGVEAEQSLHGMLGSSPPLHALLEQVRDAAGGDWTVLIEGETGSGKELVARALHAFSPRKGGPFVPVNCAGLTESLATSQLFGHRRGAFTGAVADHKGVFEAAHGGTLFLDEVGDLPPAIQTALLRVLEDKTVVPLGSSTPLRVDVRLVAATHRNLGEEVQRGAFRQDLLYRLRVARIPVPPLRSRGDDVMLLSAWFLERARAATGKPLEGFDDAAFARILAYPWPGNVRELKSAVDFAAIRCRGSMILAEDLPPELAEGIAATAAPARSAEEEIQDALRHARGNRSLAARQLGISRATFYRRLGELPPKTN